MEEIKKEKAIIVLIEDEEIMASLLTTKLEKAGYEVLLATDGARGLELIKEKKPDLVLLDMLLPVLDGFGVLEALNKEGSLPTLPVIVISNSGQPLEIERMLKLGVRDYLIKVNFDPAEVIARVNNVLESTAEPAPNISSSPPHPGKTVLIVEDDLFLSDLLERKFAQKQYTAHRAVDVEQARQMLAEHAVHIILLDIVLPGMHGITFLEELKANEAFKHIPVVIISNLGQQEEVAKGLKAGAVDYIIKANSTPGEILEKVEQILKK